MKNNLLFGLILISSFGFAQQVLKKITDTADYTIVEIYSFRNGVDGSNVTGNQNFIGNNNTGLVRFYDADQTFTLTISIVMQLTFLNHILKVFVTVLSQ